MASDREKRKKQEKNEAILAELVKAPGNGFCADCGTKGPRWASYNIGCFLCIRCGGLHRRMGTHISKIKSLTLDTWDDEMIHEWGNIKVNDLYNPRGVPAPTSDLAIEQYIRDKYERKQYMTPENRQRFGGAPASKSSYQDTSRGRGYDDAPRQTTYAEPSRADLEKHHWHLQRLKEMGFDNPSVTIPALEAHNMDITRTVDYLCSLPGHHFTSASPSSSSSSRPAPAVQAPPAATYTNEVRQLASMGFNHEKECREALAQCNGRVEDAINWLIEHQKGVSQAPPPQKAPSQPQPAQAAPQSSAKDDLLDIFGPAVPAAQAPQQQQSAPQAAAKNDIMALFGAAPASMPAYQPTPFANTSFGFPPQQQQQQQQSQPTQANNPFAGMTSSGNAPGFFGQPAQQAAPQQAQLYGSGNYALQPNSQSMYGMPPQQNNGFNPSFMPNNGFASFMPQQQQQQTPNMGNRPSQGAGFGAQQPPPSQQQGWGVPTSPPSSQAGGFGGFTSSPQPPAYHNNAQAANPFAAFGNVQQQLNQQPSTSSNPASKNNPFSF